MGEYRPAAICRRGHVYTTDLTLMPPATRCELCGAPVLKACPHCQAMIRGSYYVPGVIGFEPEYSAPGFCFSCGEPFPWADRQAKIWQLYNLLDQEDLDEASRLTVSEQLEALTRADMSEEEQLERWTRVKRLAPGLLKSGSTIVESVATAAIRAQLGI